MFFHEKKQVNRYDITLPFFWVFASHSGRCFPFASVPEMSIAGASAEPRTLLDLASSALGFGVFFWKMSFL